MADEQHNEPAAQPGVLRIYPPEGGPHASELAASSRAFAAGSFGDARRLARGVLAAADATAEERSFAAEIARRTDVDPVALAVGVASFALFWLVIYLTVWR